MPAILGKIQGWAGGHISHAPAGGPQYWNPWQRFDSFRLLYHSGLPLISDRLVVYPNLPDETKNFSDEWLYGRETQISKTLSSSIATVHQGFVDDGIVTETWTPSGGLSATWLFFHRLYKLWHNEPDRENNEYLIWRPIDRTLKAYEIEIVGLTVGGNAQEFEAQFAGRVVDEPQNWMTKAIELKLKLVREVPPQMAVQMVGGSDTGEAVAVPGN